MSTPLHPDAEARLRMLRETQQQSKPHEPRRLTEKPSDRSAAIKSAGGGALLKR